MTLEGKVKTETPEALAGHLVVALIDRRFVIGEGEDATETLIAGRAVSRIDADGGFRLELPDAEELRGEVRVEVQSPSGLRVGEATVALDDLDEPLLLAAEPIPAVELAPSDDPTLGRRERLTGRVLDERGQGARAGAVVVIWAVPLGEEEGEGEEEGADAFPLVVSTTADGGYFSEAWPSAQLRRAWGVVGGGEPVPIGLDADGRLPTEVVLVGPVPAPAEPQGEAGADCDCAENEPPRAPDQADLVSNPEAFSQDLGGACLDLTTPNRALDEIDFYGVVRTSEPEIEGVRLSEPAKLPDALVERLIRLASANRPLDIRDAERSGDDPSMRFLAKPKSSEIDERETADEPERTEEERELDPKALRLRPDIVGRMFRDPAAISAQELKRASRASRFKDVADVVQVLRRKGVGRVELDADHVVDWDDTPTTYQATTIAHGHLLHFKQVWRADGYSLGDLLHSLPLAPGQVKRIATLDWDREDVASRLASRAERERIDARISRDRDVSEIIASSLTERVRAGSTAHVEAIGGGIGGFIGPVIFGGAGGAAGAGSTAWQNAARDVAGNSLQRVRDRTLQSASALRSQRTSVVQTVQQGESLRAETDVIANHNHCHAVTMEYFEVLRHLQVTQELVDVRECLFVPFALTPFDAEKARRWRAPLQRRLRRRDLARAFDALDRVQDNWAHADFPPGRYADETIEYLDGELRLALTLPRPSDDDGAFSSSQWGPYAALLDQDAELIWKTHLGTVLKQDRDRVWNERLAPRIAARIIDGLQLSLTLDDGTSLSVETDATLVGRFRQGASMLVSLRPTGDPPGVTRARVAAVRVSLGATMPGPGTGVVHSLTIGYRTAHTAHSLIRDAWVMNDIGQTEDVNVAARLDRFERRNPREEDRRLLKTLIEHLNEHVEHYHQAIWWAMHPNRRYMLLDGFEAPGASGRSVAGVVENRLLGIVGNCLVMPVAPGIHLDPSHQPGKDDEGLLAHYAVSPPPPIRVSVPTRGVFAKAIMGACNACEVKDETRFWRWEEAPNPDVPPEILPLSTESRRRPLPNLRPDEFPEPLVRIQNAPDLPPPAALASALQLIGTPNLFRDLTGIELNQRNAAAAFKTAVETAQSFASQAGALAQQRYLQGSMDRNLAAIRDARQRNLISADEERELVQSALRGAAGERRPPESAPTSNPSVQRLLDRAAASPSSSVSVRRPTGEVEVRSGDHAVGPEGMDFDVDPPVEPQSQTQPRDCWAAGAAMMASWREGASLSLEAVADRAGAEWRQRLDAHQGIRAAEMPELARALGMRAESPQSYLPRGVLRLLRAHGPLWAVGDDAVAGNHLTHVRIVTGIHGDGSADGTQVSLIDPDPAIGATTVPFAGFAANLEASDVVRAGQGFYHW
jgi:hypothetical protein